MKLFAVLGALNGGLAVAAGAFAAHALRERLSERALAGFETGARYHMFHALALLAVAWMCSHKPASALAPAAGWAFTAGIVLFSGSLYAWALSGVRVFAMVTPLGGLTLLVAWGLLAAAAWR